jgi:hypothetical protein
MNRLRAALLVVALVVAPGISQAAPPPISGSVTVNASVCDPAAVTPSISSPVSGTAFNRPVITVSGTSTPDQPVAVYRNGTLAGTAAADAIGAFAVPITLVKGSNVLVAHNCTDSAPVTVSYVPPPVPPPAPPPSPVPPVPNHGTAPPAPVAIVINPVPAGPGAGSTDSFYLQSPAGIIEGLPGQLVEIPFVITGGTAPFRITATTGDGGSITITATDRGLILKHSFNAAGRYVVTIEITDASGNRAFLQVIVQVNPEAVAGATTPADHSGLALGLIFLLEQLLLAFLFALWEYYLRNRKTRNEQNV